MMRVILTVVGCLLFLGFSRPALSAEKAPAQASPATYVGNEVCQACHAAAFEKFSGHRDGQDFSL
jgi:cytochrome c5